MRLYHFCPAHMVEEIRNEGLRFGKFPLMEYGRVKMIAGIQWLTLEEDPNKQSWATSNMIPYSRTAFRLTIEIPESQTENLRNAAELVSSLHPRQREFVDAWEGSGMWYIFRGVIPPEWIVEAIKMEA